MKFVLLLFLVSYCFAFSYNFQVEIDSIKLELKKYSPDKRPYHLVNSELFRKYRFYNRDSAKYYLDKGLKYANEFELDTSLRDYNNLKGLYYFDVGQYDSALAYFYQCVEVSYKLVDYGAIGYSLNDIGYVFYVQGLWDLALQHYKEGVETVKGRKEVFAEKPLGILYQGVALSYLKMNKVDSAEKYIDLMLEQAQIEENKAQYYQSLLYKAELYSMKKNTYKKQDSIYREIINYYYKNREWPDGLPYSYYYLASFFEENNKIDSAVKYFNLSLQEFKNLGWERKLIDVNYTLLKLYLKKKNFSKVDSIFAFNDSLSKQFYSKDLNLDRLYNKYLIFEAKRQYDSAFYYLKEYTTANDSVLHSSVSGRISSISKDIQVIKDSKERQIHQEQFEKKLYTLIFVVVLVIILSLFLYNRYRNQKKNLSIINQQNEELNKANKLLEDANQTKDRFFSIIAHDLKNPIGAIKGTSEMMVNDFEVFDDNDKKEIATQIFEASSSVQSLLDSLLTWSRSQRGIIEFNAEEFEVELLFDSIYHLLFSSANAKQININVDVESDLVMRGDINMLNTIVRNILSNAIKFTPEKGNIDLRAFKKSDKVIFEIEDNGVGISKENIKKLFNFGTNFTSDGTNNEKGTGLGLILVKEFVDRHNGKISVESELGKGTKFIIELPNG